MDFKRISSALLGLPMVILVLLLGNKYMIDVALSIIAIISLHEYYHAFQAYQPIRWVGYLSAFAICFIHVIPTEQLFYDIALSIPFIIAILFIQLILKNLQISVIDLAISLLGIFYIVFFISFISLLAGAENGKILIWYALLTAWGTDVFAYVVGKILRTWKT